MLVIVSQGRSGQLISSDYGSSLLFVESAEQFSVFVVLLLEFKLSTAVDFAVLSSATFIAWIGIMARLHCFANFECIINGHSCWSSSHEYCNWQEFASKQRSASLLFQPLTKSNFFSFFQSILYFLFCYLIKFAPSVIMTLICFVSVVAYSCHGDSSIIGANTPGPCWMFSDIRY